MIGIMSDSHDNLDAIRKAVRFFSNLNCELVIHAGDFVAPFAASEMGRLACAVRAVFGNCDGERSGLVKTFAAIGTIRKEPYPFRFSQHSFLLTHTHFANEKHIRSGKYDVLIFGHTHKPEIRRVHSTLIINPGETGGWLTGKCSAAVLDADSLEAEIVYL